MYVLALCAYWHWQLHVLEAWFCVLLEHVPANAVVAACSDFSTEELQLATADVSGAMLQMRSTLDDVIDFRQVVGLLRAY